MQPALAVSDFTTGLIVVIWIGFLLSVGFAKIYYKAMKERELQERIEASKPTKDRPA